MLRLSEESHLLVISAPASPTLHPSLLWKSLPQPSALPPTKAPPPLPQPPLLFFNHFSILLSLYGRRRKGEQPLPGACSSPGAQVENFGVRQMWLQEAPAGPSSWVGFSVCCPSWVTLMKVIPAGIHLRPVSVNPAILNNPSLWPALWATSWAIRPACRPPERGPPTSHSVLRLGSEPPAGIHSLRWGFSPPRPPAAVLKPWFLTCCDFRLHSRFVSPPAASCLSLLAGNSGLCPVHPGLVKSLA